MEILNFKKQINPSVIAIFDVLLDKIGMTLCKFKLIKTKNGELFIAPPSYSEVATDGKKQYFPYVQFTDDKKKQFNELALEKLKPYLE